jgi:hypothetical protein
MRSWGAIAPMLLAAAAVAGAPGFAGEEVRPPPTLRATGLYAGAFGLAVDPRHLAFAPQYPLWTDGAAKRRWMSLPPGAAIDASDPETWIFPVGARFWKEFSFDGRRVETRYIERLPGGGWLYAAYAWREDEAEALLVSERGLRGAHPLANGRAHAIPSVSDCKVCHEAGGGGVLGFGALQLSPDRDPGALHGDADAAGAVDLAFLVEAGLLTGLPADLAASPPRIASTTPTERAALGYLHGNCGHCHARGGKLESLGLFLRHALGAAVAPGVATTVGEPVRKRAPGQSFETTRRIEPGRPERSAVVERVASRYAALQMPPLGTELVDGEAVALLGRWIAEMDDGQGKTTRED